MGSVDCTPAPGDLEDLHFVSSSTWVCLTFSTLCLLTSSFLSPFLLRHHLSKPRTLPTLLFLLLTLLDLLTCLVNPLRTWVYYLITGGTVIHQIPPGCHIPGFVRFFSLVTECLMMAPYVVLAVLAICRFIQIKQPFVDVQIRYVLVVLGGFAMYYIPLFGYLNWSSTAQYRTHSQLIVSEISGSCNYSLILMMVPVLICQLLSAIASFFTVVHLYKSPTVNTHSHRSNRRSSQAIVITNLGNIVAHLVFVTAFLFGVKDLKNGKAIEKDRTFRIVVYFASQVVPMVASCFNAVVFACLHPNIFSKTSGIN